jgi:hypothetical protein
VRNVAVAVLVSGLLASTAVPASTIPAYYFNGSASYTASTEILSTVSAGTSTATLFQSVNLPPSLSVVPASSGVIGNVVGSVVDLTVQLQPTSIVDNGLQTNATFMPLAGEPAALYLGNGSGGTSSTPVLTGTLSNITLSGPDGLNMGFLTAYLHPTGGSAIGYFSDPSSVLALDFDLTTTFGAGMFGSSFSGQINGDVQSLTAVPLPPGFALLASALALMLGAMGLPARRRQTAPLACGVFHDR